jgi:hypothetical protein
MGILLNSVSPQNSSSTKIVPKQLIIPINKYYDNIYQIFLIGIAPIQSPKYNLPCT